MIVHNPEFDFMDQVFLAGKICVEVREWCGRQGDWHHSVHILFENGNGLTEPFASGTEGSKYETIARILRIERADNRTALWQLVKPRLFGGNALFVSCVSAKRLLHNQGRLT